MMVRKTEKVPITNENYMLTFLLNWAAVNFNMHTMIFRMIEKSC